MKNNTSILKKICFSSAFALGSSPLAAFAVQQHGGAEGLVSHQIGHILFISGMVYLLYRVFSIGMTGPGWFEFKGFLWLIISWHLLTFTGHWMREIVSSDKFVKQGIHVTGYVINDLFDVYFYFTRLDHLRLVPSFIFLFRALRKWRKLSWQYHGCRLCLSI